MEPIEIMIEEYKTLRDEVAKALGHRLQIVSLGLATIALLIGSASLATMKNFDQISALILVFGIPSLSFLTAHIWLSEAHRARRASWYIWGLEKKLMK